VGLLCAIYIAALWWIDRKNGAFTRLLEQVTVLALMLPLVLASYAARYARWFWLLRKAGQAPPIWRGFLAYLAGFALTATPGKAGELLRIRYFESMGIPPSRTMAVFVFERACDLLVILLLSLLAASVFPTIGLLCLVVLAFVGALFGFAAWPGSARCLAWTASRLRKGLLKSAIDFIGSAIRELQSCLTWRSLAMSTLSGGLAWSLTALVFLGICSALGIHAPLTALFGIYPLAMLIGALSFVPGGVGTTELAIVLILERLGIPTPDALAAAIGVRLVTLWFAILVGALSLLILEGRLHKDVAQRIV
jgi:uncharacterized protein (TIRG00374 family)